MPSSLELAACSQRFFSAFYRFQCFTHKGEPSNRILHATAQRRLHLSRSLSFKKRYDTTHQAAGLQKGPNHCSTVAGHKKPTRSYHLSNGTSFHHRLTFERRTQCTTSRHLHSTSQLTCHTVPILPSKARQRLPRCKHGLEYGHLRRYSSKQAAQTISTGDTSITTEVADDVRELMRFSAAPVAVVLASVPEFRFDRTRHSFEAGQMSPATQDCAAMTISSFTTVSLAPEPVVSFNIKTPSRTWDCIVAHRAFRVCFLKGTRRAAALADCLTRPESKSSYASILSEANRTEATQDDDGSMSSLFWQEHELYPVPSLHAKHVVAADLYCELLHDQTVRCGDHVVLFAAVKSTRRDLGGADVPLMYHNGRFREGVGRGIPL